MPVVINEFEVVEPPAAPAAPAGAAAATPAPVLPDPRDLQRALAELAEAQLRTWSH
jgi:hypothetical protein